MCLDVSVHLSIRATAPMEPPAYMSARLCKRWHERKQQMVGGRRSHVDGKTEARQTTGKFVGPADTDIPLFSMAWIRLTRAGGAVSGGVNCSLRSGIETAETTTQITVTLLAQSL